MQLPCKYVRNAHSENPENPRIKGVAPVSFKFQIFHGLDREKMGSVSLAPLHGSTGATVHINQPKQVLLRPKTAGFRVRERAVARAVLCKQTGVSIRVPLPIQRSHAESHCLFCTKLRPTHTQVVYRPLQRRKAAVKAAASGC